MSDSSPEQTILAAFQAFFGNAATFPGLAGVYIDTPPLPFTGPYPIVVLGPGNQDLMTESQASDQLVGYYKVRYLDELGDNAASTTSLTDMRAQARAFAFATRTALRHLYTLTGTAAIVGKGNPGLRALYDDIQVVYDDAELPIFEFVQLILVRGMIES